jgi:hypothetical protein
MICEFQYLNILVIGYAKMDATFNGAKNKLGDIRG